jgi:hypothetical protein
MPGHEPLGVLPLSWLVGAVMSATQGTGAMDTDHPAEESGKSRREGGGPRPLPVFQGATKGIARGRAGRAGVPSCATIPCGPVTSCRPTTCGSGRSSRSPSSTSTLRAYPVSPRQTRSAAAKWTSAR